MGQVDYTAPHDYFDGLGTAKLEGVTEPNGIIAPDCEVALIPLNGSETVGPSITKVIDAQSSPWVAGGTIDYEFEVTNDTGESLTDVEIVDALDTGSPIVVGSMAVDDVVTEGFTYTITAEDVAAGEITNGAVITAEGATVLYRNEVILVSASP